MSYNLRKLDDYKEEILDHLRDAALQTCYKVDTRISIINGYTEGIYLDCYPMDEEAMFQLKVDEYIERLVMIEEKEIAKKIIVGFMNDVNRNYDEFMENTNVGFKN